MGHGQQHCYRLCPAPEYVTGRRRWIDTQHKRRPPRIERGTQQLIRRRRDAVHGSFAEPNNGVLLDPRDSVQQQPLQHGLGLPGSPWVIGETVDLGRVGDGGRRASGCVA